MTAQLRNADSGKTEYYTPAKIVDAARRTLGHFDLDPFSSESANQIVKAPKFFTLADDGFSQPWEGRVWMNPPFGKFTAIAVRKLVLHYFCGEVETACCITHANTSEKWFQILAQFPQCFLSPRTNYIDGVTGTTTNSATKGSVVTYMGEDVEAFRREFRGMGQVKV